MLFINKQLLLFLTSDITGDHVWPWTNKNGLIHDLSTFLDEKNKTKDNTDCILNKYTRSTQLEWADHVHLETASMKSHPENSSNIQQDACNLEKQLGSNIHSLRHFYQIWTRTDYTQELICPSSNHRQENIFQKRTKMKIFNFKHVWTFVCARYPHSGSD